jgi:hypothetical protein
VYPVLTAAAAAALLACSCVTRATPQTTTTTAAHCCGPQYSLFNCVLQCAFVGFVTDPNTGQQVPLYEWTVCRDACGALSFCTGELIGQRCDGVLIGTCVNGFCHGIANVCGPNQCNDPNTGSCVDCAPGGVTAAGTVARDCSDCLQVTIADSPARGATGVI